MRPQPSLHSNFFSSLKQVEKRLKLEDPLEYPSFSPPPPPPQPQPQPQQQTNEFSTEALSSPIYLLFDQPTSHISTLHDSSEPPQAFLSSSPLSTQTQQNQSQSTGVDPPKTFIETENHAADDIQRLIQLLGLSDCDDKEEDGEKPRVPVGLGDCACGNSCACEGGFYDKIVGVKGPKCKKEAERLEGWIQYFMNGCGVEERKEPLRLAYLLLGKAAFVSEDADGGFGGLESPSSIEEFLLNDPPKD